jgi:His Kinase A (phospho-acceptor) domain
MSQTHFRLISVCFRYTQEVKHKEDIHRLLRTISHEIRNPLHGILGNAQALLDTLQELEQRVAAAAAEASRQAALAVAAAAAADKAVATHATICAARCISSADSLAVSDVPSNCSNSSSALSDDAVIGTSHHLSDSSTVDSSAASAEQQQHSASSSDTVPATAAAADSMHVLTCTAYSGSSGSSGRSSSSSCACSNTALLHELSRKLHTVREMVAEIHECGLHQVCFAMIWQKL